MGSAVCTSQCHTQTSQDIEVADVQPLQIGAPSSRSSEADWPSGKMKRAGSRYTLEHDSVGTLEQLEWLNFLISHTWPQLEQLACHFVEFKIEPLMQKALPDQLKGLKLSKFTMGERPPRMEVVEVYDLPHGTSCVHAALDCKSEMEMEWEVRGITFGIKDVSLHGEVVFLLRPFIQEHPGTGGVTVFFINPPEVNFHFTGVARVAELRGIKNMIRSVLDDVVAEVLVMPNVITLLMRYSDYTLYPMVMGSPTPIGLLRVQTMKAYDMPSGDYTLLGLLKGGVDDNYVKICLGNDRWTTKVNKAALGGTHEFFIYDPEQQLKLDLWDADYYTVDDHLGHAGPFLLHEALQLSEKGIRFHDPSDPSKPAGTIVLKMDYYHGTPRALGLVVNGIMLTIREVHMPPSMKHCVVYIQAEFGGVEKRSRYGAIMSSAAKDKTVASVMDDMEKRLRQHGLSEKDVRKLTAAEGLTCNSVDASMAINECMTFMVPDGAGLDAGEIKMKLMQEVRDDNSKPVRGKRRSVVDIPLGHYVLKLRDLGKAPQLTLPGPVVFKHADGSAYTAEVCALVCGFKAGRPHNVSASNRDFLRRAPERVGSFL